MPTITERQSFRDNATLVAACLSAAVLLTILIVVIIAFYAPVGGGGVIRRSVSSLGAKDEVSVTADRQLIVNLLGSRSGEESVFGSRRMGVAVTEGSSPSQGPIVDWEPALNSGFSVRVQVIGRASLAPLAIADVACFTFFFVGTRDSSGVTSITGDGFDQLEQHTGDPALPIPKPSIEVDAANQRVIVNARGLDGFTVFWGADIEVLQSVQGA